MLWFLVLCWPCDVLQFLHTCYGGAPGNVLYVPNHSIDDAHIILLINVNYKRIKFYVILHPVFTIYPSRCRGAHTEGVRCTSPSNCKYRIEWNDFFLYLSSVLRFRSIGRRCANSIILNRWSLHVWTRRRGRSLSLTRTLSLRRAIDL